LEDGHLSSIGVLLLLAALHGIVVLAYAALTHAPTRSDDDEDRPDRLTYLKRNLPRLDISVQLTLLLLRVAVFALATVLVSVLWAAETPDVLLRYAVVLLPLALLFYLLADLLPATIGRARAEQIAPALGLVLSALLLNPLAGLLLAAERVLNRAAGGSNTARSVTEEELITLVEGGDIATSEKEMIVSVLEFRDTLAREVMVPRLDMAALSIENTLEDALDVFVESGHSRIPIYEESIDNIKGLLYAKDLLTLMKAGDFRGRSIAELMRPAYFVPESKRADRLFKEMQKSKIHLAVVTDEYGGTAGLVTIEDLIEEIVGDIQDEYDIDEEADYVQQGADEYLVDASMNLEDFAELLDVVIEDEENDTVGGFIIGQLERVPEVGEVVETEEMILRVMSVDGRRIRKVHVTRRPQPGSEAEADEPSAEPDPQVNGRGALINGTASHEASA
jgi:CBS domain containing-hemolysin-like protein